MNRRVRMAWLIGAIAIYGIVTLLIGIAVLVYLDRDGSPDPKAGEAEARPNATSRIGHAGEHAGSGTRLIGAR
jgi:hypothetical protein